jgi:hypothetical protein
MPDYKVYIPEAKAGLLYQYKEQFGKDASPMIVGFMEQSVVQTPKIRENPEETTRFIYEIYFGDIENEREFSDLLGGRENMKAALLNRTAELCKKYPDIYPEVIAQFKENYPRLAKITGMTT